MIAEHITEITILNAPEDVASSVVLSSSKDNLLIYDFEIRADQDLLFEPITLQWKIPGINVKGVWKPTTDFSKRIQADWELENMESRISIDAPVIGIFGHDDCNISTFSCSEVIEKIEMNARIREEDNCMYCHITFFTENYHASTFKAQLRLDQRTVHFSEALRSVSKWWETDETLTPAYVPPIAKTPLYSTWYQFHQNLDEDILLKECKMASEIGYKAIIIDDGWQTNDNNRGYDYTGDWQPDRIPNMRSFVDGIHGLGMKVALWYSVPFCGKKSKAYQLFKGKFLTENHRWAPVFDPRYPDVREYLVNIYANALKDWNLDGVKLDFIDDFRLYKDTPIYYQENEMDYASVNEAVDRLMNDVSRTLQAINPDVFIEFRQKYIGPAMRKYGNMLRAFDCPGDAVMNRVRIADIRMLCGNSAVHSDMVTWHEDEKVEVAALQIINILFGVPQLSIMLHEANEEHLAMITFYTKYWNDNSATLVQGDFLPSRPLANYPTQRVSKDKRTIIGVYEEYVTTLESEDDSVHILNGQIAEQIVIRNIKDFGNYHCKVYDCMGTIVLDNEINFSKGLLEIAVPPCGILIAEKSK